MKKLVRLTAHTLRGNLVLELSGSGRGGGTLPVVLLIDQKAPGPTEDIFSMKIVTLINFTNQKS